VVVGILIALYINNWNEERKTKELTRELFSEIQSDLLISLDNIQAAIETHNFQFLWIRRILLDKVDRSDYEEIFGLPQVIQISPQPRFQDQGFEKLNNSVIKIPHEYREAVDELNDLYEKLEYTTESYNMIGDIVLDNHDKIASSQDWYAEEYWQLDEAFDYYLNSPEYKNLVRKFNFVINDSNLFDDMYDLIKTYNMLARITKIHELPKEFDHLLSENLQEFGGPYQWQDSIQRKELGDRVVSVGDGYLMYTGNQTPFYQIAKDSFVSKYNNGLIFRRDSLNEIIGAVRVFVGELSELEKIE
jgi:hypothetical protein